MNEPKPRTACELLANPSVGITNPIPAIVELHRAVQRLESMMAATRCTPVQFLMGGGGGAVRSASVCGTGGGGGGGTSGTADVAHGTNDTLGKPSNHQGGDLDLQARTETQLRYDLIMIRGQVYDLEKEIESLKEQLRERTQQLIDSRAIRPLTRMITADDCSVAFQRMATEALSPTYCGQLNRWAIVLDELGFRRKEIV